MKMFLLLAAMGLVGVTRVVGPVDAAIRGDYVEARTASVFAGACHYNGEVVTTGREAVMAWSISSGQWHGTDLSGVRAAAAVRGQDNLGDDKSPRQSELVIDSSASDAQARALEEMLEARAGKSLGKMISVKRGPVAFTNDRTGYHVAAAGFMSCTVQPMPNAACCKQPNLVWYTPLTPLTDRKVGFTGEAAYLAGTLGDAWDRSGENSAFYGHFAF